jgi:hypothetical protein
LVTKGARTVALRWKIVVTCCASRLRLLKPLRNLKALEITALKVGVRDTLACRVSLHRSVSGA